MMQKVIQASSELNTRPCLCGEVELTDVNLMQFPSDSPQGQLDEFVSYFR